MDEKEKSKTFNELVENVTTQQTPPEEITGTSTISEVTKSKIAKDFVIPELSKQVKQDLLLAEMPQKPEKKRIGVKPLELSKYSKRIIELRREGKFLKEIGTTLGISDRTIARWIVKGKQANDENDAYFIFSQSLTQATNEAEVLSLNNFDKEIEAMSEHTPDFNKYLDTKSRVLERRNRLRGGGGNVTNVQVHIKQKFVGWS